MYKRYALLLTALGPISVLTPLYAQAPDTATTPSSASMQEASATPDSETMLKPIEVTATRLSRPFLTTPAAISVLSADQVQQAGPGINPSESLRQVPGLMLMNDQNFAQGQKISMRGFGARSAFGIRGITINVDGIPYTMPDGQSQIDSLDIDSIENIQVLRGPASVLYGNAAGGVINVTTADGLDKDAGGRIGITTGSHGLRKYRVSHSGSEGNWSHSIGFTSLRQDGYRDHSRVEKYLLNGKLSYHFDDKRTLTTLVNILESPRSDDPGGLTIDQVKANRHQANKFSHSLDSRSKTSQQIVGLSYQDLDMAGGEFNASTWFGRRNYYQVLPFPSQKDGSGNVPQFVRHEYGARTSYANNVHLALPVHYVVGADISRMEDNRHRYATNASMRHWERVTSGADQKQNGTDAGIFAQADVKLTDQWTWSSGLRYDNVHLTINDRQGGMGSGGRHFDQWSYSNGLTWQYLKDHAVYATVGTAFQTPTFTEFARPDGDAGFNPSVKPQKATNYEIGMRGTFPTRTQYQLALYTIRSKDELVAYSIDNGPTYYQNAGRTRREGIELGLSTPLPAGFSADTDFTYMRARFSDNLSGTDVSRNNHLPGLPERVWSTRLNWQHEALRLTFENQYLSGMYADNANKVAVDSSWIYNLRGSYAFPMGNGHSLTLSAGLDNLFNEHYYSNIRVNDANSRYYEPAPDRTFYASVQYGF